MELNEYIEHTVLKQGVSKTKIKEAYSFCSENRIPTLVIPPSSVRYASGLSDGTVTLCTVAGFPLGFSTFSVKLYELEDAKFNGAREIDLVIDNSLVKQAEWEKFSDELSSYRRCAEGLILKVIVETSLLTREELGKTAQALIDNGIDYIKTSTGFVGYGACLDDVKFLKENFGNDIRIKASGGIRTRHQVIEFIDAGADRIGTSSTEAILKFH